MAPRRSLLSVIALASALALSACGGNAQPTTSGTPSVIETPDSTKPTPASSTAPARNIPEPQMPEAAKANTKEGLQTFTIYWASLISYAYETGNTQPMKAVAEPNCSSCISWAADAADANWESGWAVGGKISVVDFVTDFQPLADESISSWVTFKQEAMTLYNSEGNVKNQVSGGETAPLEVIAKYSDGGWRVVTAGKA